MKMRDLRELERHIKTVEAATRLERDDIKGLTVQVIFDGPGRGNDVPVQMFVSADHPGFDTIMAVVQGQVDIAKTEAEGRINATKAQFARD